MFVPDRFCIIILVLCGALTAGQRQTAETQSSDITSGKHVKGLFCYIFTVIYKVLCILSVKMIELTRRLIIIPPCQKSQTLARNASSWQGDTDECGATF